MIVSVVIPTYNAVQHLPVLLDRLSEQTIPHELIIIDSNSKDGTQELLKRRNISFYTVLQHEFNHGRTRNQGVALAKGKWVIMLTQDALPASSETFEQLINAIESYPMATMGYGRQLPYSKADSLSWFARFKNYPAVSQVKNKADILSMGIRTCYCSNSFAAYRKDKLQLAGGFPTDTIIGEDVVVAARAILNGDSVVYSAEAQVYHSHNYTIMEEFKRYFDIGSFHQQQKLLLTPFSRIKSEGYLYVLSEWNYLRTAGKLNLIPLQLIRTIAKLVGYQLGLHQQHLPQLLKKKLSMHPSFWQDPG